MNNKVLDALDYCLHAIQDGASVEAVLARYPELAEELRPLLETARAAHDLKGPEPSEATISRTRSRLLQRASQMRAPRRKNVLPFFQRLAFAAVLALVLLLSGNGLVKASSTTLPGDNLYPVKRSWEDVRLSLVFNPLHRDVLESKYEQERLDEVAEVLQQGRLVPIMFSGVVTAQVPGQITVSGISVAVSTQTRLPATPILTGSSVIVTGTTDSLGQVAALELQALPSGSLVPVAQVVGSQPEGEGPDGHSSTFHLEGTVNSIQGTLLTVDGRMVRMDLVQVPPLAVGDPVEVQGYFTADGQFFAAQIEIERPDSEGPDEPLGTDLEGQKESPEETHTPDEAPKDKSEDHPEDHPETEVPEAGH